jgi:hypothetical protein
MNGNLTYEMAKQRIAEQQQAAGRAREAREARAAGRGRRRRRDAVDLPEIPDFAHELLAAIPDSRPEAPRGRRARAGR